MRGKHPKAKAKARARPTAKVERAKVAEAPLSTGGKSRSMKELGSELG